MLLSGMFLSWFMWLWVGAKEEDRYMVFWCFSWQGAENARRAWMSFMLDAASGSKWHNISTSSSSSLSCRGKRGHGCKACRPFLFGDTFLGGRGMAWRGGIFDRGTEHLRPPLGAYPAGELGWGTSTTRDKGIPNSQMSDLPSLNASALLHFSSFSSVNASEYWCHFR